MKGKVLELFSSYLTNRQQIVVIDGEKSFTREVKAGIPQGSKLGTILSLIYINDITLDIESDIQNFADDTSLLATGKTTEITSEILNRDLQKISKCAAMWKVNFQADKSEEIILSSKRLESKNPLNLNGEIVKRVETNKHLGLYLSFNLDWSIQCHHVCLKAYRKLTVLRSVK